MPVKITWTEIPEEFDENENPHKNYLPQIFENLLIKSDNFFALQEFVQKKMPVDFIYIDPPYNTGKDFAYKDKFSEDFWLSFMNRRLRLAQKTLVQSGVIFIAIDRSELYPLKLLCDEIFGAENFVNDFMWLHGKGKKDKWSRTLQQHTLCYAKNKKKLLPFSETEFSSWATTNQDGDARGNWFSGSVSFSEKRSNKNHKNYYSITSPGGKIWTRQWQISKEEMQNLINEDKIFWGRPPKYAGVPRKKIFNETETKVIPKNIISNVQSTRAAQKHLNSLLKSDKDDFCGVFENPKPVDLILHFLKIAQLPQNAIILDFFAGSGTTFEAVCKLNRMQNSRRKCVLVQKDENDIAEICKKRCQKTATLYNQKIDFVNF